MLGGGKSMSFLFTFIVRQIVSRIAIHYYPVPPLAVCDTLMMRSAGLSSGNMHSTFGVSSFYCPYHGSLAWYPRWFPAGAWFRCALPRSPTPLFLHFADTRPFPVTRPNTGPPLLGPSFTSLSCTRHTSGYSRHSSSDWGS